MFIAVRTGLEPVTSCVTGRHSNQAELTHLSCISQLRLQRYGDFFNPPNVSETFYKKSCISNALW